MTDVPTPTIPAAARTVPVDFPGLSVGVAEYPDGPTGCTVLRLDRFAAVSIDVRGGIPAVFNQSARATEAVCLAGGSVLGLAASVGVAEELFAEHGRDPRRLPGVIGGVIYDFAPAGRTGVYPDAELGRAALRSARSGPIPVGAIGAGRMATCGKLGRAGWAESGGQGVASGRIGEPRVLVFVVVNALGVLVDRRGAVVRGNRNPETGERSRMTAEEMVHGAERQRSRFASPATTLTVVLTDARLSTFDRTQLSRQVHASLARAIHPLHASGDGDALWLLSTNEVTDPSITPTALGEFASDLAWDAVLTSFDETG